MFCSKYKEKLRNVEDKISHIENVELRNIRIEIDEKVGNIICDNHGCNNVCLTVEEVTHLCLLYFYSNNFKEDFTNYLKNLYPSLTTEEFDY